MCSLLMGDWKLSESENAKIGNCHHRKVLKLRIVRIVRKIVKNRIGNCHKWIWSELEIIIFSYGRSIKFPEFGITTVNSSDNIQFRLFWQSWHFLIQTVYIMSDNYPSWHFPIPITLIRLFPEECDENEILVIESTQKQTEKKWQLWKKIDNHRLQRIPCTEQQARLRSRARTLEGCVSVLPHDVYYLAPAKEGRK